MNTKKNRGKVVCDIRTEHVCDLQISMEHAQALADVLCFVGGNPDKSRRGYIQDILCALTRKGVAYSYPVQDIIEHVSITFKSFENGED